MQLKQLFILGGLVMFATTATAQLTPVEKTSSSTNLNKEELERLPFRRGVNEFIIQQNIGISRTKPDEGEGHSNSTNINVTYNRFLVDGFAVGLEFAGAFSGDHYTTTSLSREWIAYAGLTYGHSFSGNFNLYGKVSAGFGQSKSKFEMGNMTTETETDLFGIKVEIGAPLPMFSSGGVYVTPHIGYNYVRQKYEDATGTDTYINAGIRFENYGPCASYGCDCKNGRRFSLNSYGQGRSYIGYNTMGEALFGGKSEYEDDFGSSESDFSGGELGIQYGFYIIPNLALGAGVEFAGLTYKNDNLETSLTEFMFTPMLRAHLPTKNCWNNMFIEGGYGFGSEKTKSGSNTIEYNLNEICVNLGYNYFIADHLALTPKFGFEWFTREHKETSVKPKWSGFEFSFGGTIQF